MSVATLATGLGAAGCSGDSAIIGSGDAGDGGGDGPGIDSTVDSSQGDSGVPDSRPQDSGHPDTSGRDTGSQDTGSQDTGTEDTGTADAPVDSGPVDSGMDAAPVDAPADAGIVCDPVIGTSYFVDPVNGIDSPASTGSDMAGGLTAGACAFKTIRYAIAVLGNNPPMGTTITLLGDDSTAINGETFPLAVPTNTIVQGATGTETITVSGTTTADGGIAPADGFHLNRASSGLSTLNVSAAAVAIGAARGVVAGTGALATTTLDNITISGFADSGIRVEGTGTLTLNPGTVSTGNRFGLHVTDNASALVNGSNLAQTAISQNGAGILVQAGGSIQLTGTPGTGSAGTVVVNSNTLYGVELMPATNTMRTLPTGSSIDGVVVWGSGSDGIVLYGGANVRVRNSTILNNSQNGIYVTNNPDNCMGAPGCDDNDYTAIDLGALGSAGLNMVQDIMTGSPNNNVGICFLPATAAVGGTLTAQGNIFGTIDCSMTPAMLTHFATCAVGSHGDIGASANGTVSTTLCTN